MLGRLFPNLNLRFGKAIYPELAKERRIRMRKPAATPWAVQAAAAALEDGD